MGAPFVRMPTWGQFLALAEDQKVRLVRSKRKLNGPRGETPPVRYFKKDDGPEVIAPALKKSDVMNPILLASLCRAIPVDPTPLGISLEDLPPVEFPPWP